MKLNIKFPPWTIICLFLIFLFSCENSNSRQNALGEKKKEKISNEKIEILGFKLNDTIRRGEIATGNVHYNTALEKSEDSVISSRYIFFHYVINDRNEVLNLEAIKEDENHWIQEDTIGNGKFEFKFQYKPNENESDKRKVFHGAIEDIRILKSIDTTQNTVVETKEVKLTKELIVINPQ
ncbi:hypothetical protein LB467_12755 [Salegentibacter sp. JZCK2]|uniref:hypothetical protein n=1 Tax=Salegentibacter tibetensis TaxID=2873600 RepID=UPI001CCF86E5|nr:hypothetical protein [Salegentibacter tibetensis]MBZ9730557.1 hypothetical protein [Salegentibacter tibetensis]